MNRLANETSPYLLQHAGNPVDWYPWGEEAFAKARAEDKPILLSIGYSACHWCHVMEHESFENDAIAALMNESFVSIKVDREERPDLDEIYMSAVQMLTRRGGWPMTVFLTPEGKPFFGGTYYPPEDRQGMPGFPRVLQAVVEAYRNKPQDVARNVDQIVAALDRMNVLSETGQEMSVEVVTRGAEGLTSAYDAVHGGFGRAPKFPNAGVFNLFLRAHRLSGNRRYLEMITETLRKMAEGGMYDQLGGGFHRYSVDDKWLVPHFEKMLYDNGQLAQVYAEAYRITGDGFFKRVVEETLDYVLREMCQPEGGFYSAQDADSEGEEGKFFVWSHEEILGLLGKERGDIFCRVYDVTDLGNFEGKNILHPILTVEQAAKYFRKEEEEIEAVLAECRARLFEEREKRIKPFRDEKVIISWNGLMLSGVAAAYAITGDARIREAGARTVDFVFTRMFENGLLLHTYKDGRAKLLGYLDDYAFLIAGLLDLFEATFEPELLERSKALARTMVEEFWDEENGGFFYTGKSHEQLISRTKPGFDSSIPSGNSVAVMDLLRLHHYTGDPDLLDRAGKTLRLHYDAMAKEPFGLSNMLGALDYHLSRPAEIVLVAARDDAAADALAEEIQRSYLPNKTFQWVSPDARLEEISPLLEGKTQVGGKPTVYVCRNFTCAPPVTDWEGLKPLLEE